MTMNVGIVGAGLLGLFTARALQRAGARVTVYERREGPGLETSFANGAVLHPSAVDPWNSPGIGRVLWHSLRDPDATVRLHPKALPSLAGWGLRFLRESAPARHRAHTRDNVALALRSVALMAELPGEGIVYDAASPGTLAVHRDTRALAQAVEWARWLHDLGVPHGVLDRDALLAREPSLRPLSNELAGAIHFTGDALGDAQRCCASLAQRLAALGVDLHWRCPVTALTRHPGGGLVVRHGEGRTQHHDHVVVAAAVWSEDLVAPLGLRLPVRPAKGYSLTFRREDGRSEDTPPAWMPRHPLIDNTLHIAITPLPGRLRVAGTAEFRGFDPALDSGRVAMLQRQLARVYPALARAPAGWTVQGWTGLRPLSVDGKPLIGATRVPGLWLNTGHGPLGWTTAAASAEMLTAALAGQRAPIDAAPFAPSRFGL